MSTRCSRGACLCDVSPERLAQGAVHCSDSCAAAAAGAQDDGPCDCGHAGCAPARPPPPDPDESDAVIAIGAQYPEGK